MHFLELGIRFILNFIFIVFSISFQCAEAQVVINGQIFTKGLSIVDSPALNSSFSAGGTLPVAIEVSGNGKLSPDTPVSASQSTRFDLLEVFLVSSETSANITVSAGSDLLDGQSGTVRHLNWDIPKCISGGQYNFTLYETSHIDGQAYFSITPIPITIYNSAVENTCPIGSNPLQSQPQASSPISQSPFLPVSAMTTLEYFSTVTVTTTLRGQPTTTTLTTTYTTTMAAGQDTSGFFPVNASRRNKAGPLSIVLSAISSFSIFTILYAL